MCHQTSPPMAQHDIIKYSQRVGGIQDADSGVLIKPYLCWTQVVYDGYGRIKSAVHRQQQTGVRLKVEPWAVSASQALDGLMTDTPHVTLEIISI